MIHFASKSIPIEKNELKLLFEYKYRSNHARELTNDGDGVGLSMAKYIVGQWGGQIRVKTKEHINIFSLKLPKYLFRPPIDVGKREVNIGNSIS